MPATSKHHPAPLGLVIRLGNLSKVVVTQYPGDELVTVRITDDDVNAVDLVGPLVGQDRNEMGLYQLVIEMERQLSKLVKPS